MRLGLRLFLPFAAGYFLSYLLRNVNAVIAPELTRELDVSAAELGLLTSAYLLAFSVFQLPLGILLDRYGPRRVETVLLLVAAAGSAAFGMAATLGELVAARAVIGLGVSACLMAAFKAFSVWYPADRLPALNAAVMMAGGFGALTATTPLAWAAPMLGRQGLFLALAGFAVVAALAIHSTPEKPAAAAGGTLSRQLRDLGGILRSRVFWSYAPMAAMGLGGFLALQGLWAVPWLMEVGGADRNAAAFHMLLTTIAMVSGFLAVALGIDRIRRVGLVPSQVMGAGNLIGVAAMAALWADAGASHVLWFVLGVVFATGNLAYAELTTRFAPALAGRVNTALNLAALGGAFAVQWGYGVMLDGLRAGGWSTADSHRATFLALTLLQAGGLGWYYISRNAITRAGSADARKA